MPQNNSYSHSVNNARPPIFDDVCRTDASPASHQETSFQFLNRVQGDYWDQVRELVQEWFDHVANDVDYRQLRGDFRADNGASHSAFLELYVHESLRRAGYRVVIHPGVPNTTRCPDFLVEGFGDTFYVEATMPGTSDASQGPARRRADFLDTIQGTRNQDFFLSLDHLVVGPNPAKGRRVRAAVEQWLAGLDIDNVSYGGQGRRARFSWALDGWEVEFSAIPIPVENRGNPNHRIIGVYADSKGSYPDDASIIRAALETKANAYGALEHPFIIALGTYIWGGDRSDSTDALYGSTVVIWDEAVQKTRVGRLRDGFFGTEDHPASQGVAAVLHINQLQPYYLQRAEVTLWPHPAEADSVVDHLADRIPAIVMRASDGRVEPIPSGINPGVFFGLPDPWPTGEAFPK